MKKLFLFSLMMVASSAWAEWIIYATTVSSNQYFDPATIRKEGNISQVWRVIDLKNRHKDGWMSLRIKTEYNCKQESSRFLTLTIHSEPMANGHTLGTEGEDNNWIAIPPGTADETILKIVCAK